MKKRAIHTDLMSIILGFCQKIHTFSLPTSIGGFWGPLVGLTSFLLRHIVFSSQLKATCSSFRKLVLLVFELPHLTFRARIPNEAGDWVR
jgi:hypothetical protein